MQKFLSTAVAVALCLGVFVGCSGKPQGFPRVKPCEITVTNGGEPVEGVDVALIPETPISGVIVGGMTDASGKCVVHTTFANYKAPGSPEGEFTVVLRKDPTPSTPELTIDQLTEMSRSEIDEYNDARRAEIDAMPKIIPPDMTSMQTSPIKVNVPSDAKKAVDLAQ